MSKKRHKPEEIVSKLLQVDVLTSQGKTVAELLLRYHVIYQSAEFELRI